MQYYHPQLMTMYRHWPPTMQMYALGSNGEPVPANGNGAVVPANGNGAVVPDNGNVAVVPANGNGEPILEETGPWMLSTPVALQAFSIASGIAGGMAGFLLASRLQKSLKVSTSQVMMATGLSVLATFGAIFFIRTVEEWPSA